VVLCIEGESFFQDYHMNKKYSGKILLHRKKKVREFPVPGRDVTTKLSLGGNNDVITELFLPRGSLVSDIPAGDEKLVNLFLRCIIGADSHMIFFSIGQYLAIQYNLFY